MDTIGSHYTSNHSTVQRCGGGGLKCRPSNSSGTDLAVAQVGDFGRVKEARVAEETDKKITLPII